MNFLTLVFAFLLIFSFGTLAILEKQVTDRPLNRTFLGHKNANRKILARPDQKVFAQFGGKVTQKPDPKPPSDKAPAKSPPTPLINPECARLNISKLIQEEKEAHLLLYETALKLLKTFYGKTLFGNQKGFEVAFLDSLLKSAKAAIAQDPHFTLEKLDFKDERLQRIYYRMLKGTKERNVAAGVGYPSLLDSIEINLAPTKVCLFHAHPDQLTVFWGRKVAKKLHATVHGKDRTPMTEELIRRVCAEEHYLTFNSEIFTFVDCSHRTKQTRSSKAVCVEQDKDTSLVLRQNVYNH